MKMRETRERGRENLADLISWSCMKLYDFGIQKGMNKAKMKRIEKEQWRR